MTPEGLNKPTTNSLAVASGQRVSALLSVLICTAHVLFAYAQFSGQESDCPGIGSTSAFCPSDLPNDGLVEVILRGTVNFDARNLLANTLSVVEDKVCGEPCPAPSHANTTCSAFSCDECMAVGKLGFQQRCALRVERSVMHLSYLYMIRELWTRDQCPDCYAPGDPCCTGYHPGRPATAILVSSSFIWPHVKLLPLHAMYYMKLPVASRRNRNYWLAFFGKWTLTDVLVWCACIGVFHGLSVDDSLLSLW